MPKEIKQETKEEKNKIHLEIVTQMITLSSSAFGLVAALAWNSVIQEFVTNYIKPLIGSGSGMVSLIIYAVIVTVLAVIITLQLSRLKEKLS
jgi:Zn-dependent protease with chaperone function